MTEKTHNSHLVSNFTYTAISDLHWHARGEFLMYWTSERPSDNIMLPRQTVHCHAMKGIE